MNKNIRMIGLDLDGTLLTSAKEFTAHTKEVLKKAIEQGVIVLVVTGRPFTAIPKELQSFPGMRYAVTTNGAKVLDLEKQEVLYETLLPFETAMEALKILLDYDAIQEFFVDGVSYTSAECLRNIYDYFEDLSMPEYMLKTRNPVEDVLESMRQMKRPVDKVHGIFKDLGQRKEALARLQKIDGLVVTSAVTNSLEINREGTNKGIAMMKLGELLGIQREEMMACGDGMNDFAMLSAVGFSVAMQNGHKRIKEIADYITDSNDDDGVAKAIEKFILK